MESIGLWFREHHADVRAWLLDLEKDLPLPLYLSVDIRDAGYRAAVVDANAFPAGWNNLSPVSRTIAAEAVGEYFATHFPGIARIGIVPEHHTRNPYYFDNLDALRTIVKAAGFDAEITHFNPEFEKDVTTVEGSHDNQLSLHRLRRDGARVIATTFDPDILLLNNDLAGGLLPELDGIEQPIVPATQLGWFRRRKSRHFEITTRLLTQFQERFGIDAWLLGAIQTSVCSISFRDREGLDRIADALDRVLEESRRKHRQYHLPEDACGFVKDNSGTYGQAVIHVSNSDEIRNINRKKINQMDVGKGSVKVDEVLIQECVPTRFVTPERVGEPVIYMMGDTVLGGFARMNTEQGPHENLNARGAYFTTIETLGELQMDVYEFLTRISRIAIAYETLEMK